MLLCMQLNDWLEDLWFPAKPLLLEDWRRAIAVYAAAASAGRSLCAAPAALSIMADVLVSLEKSTAARVVGVVEIYCCEALRTFWRWFSLPTWSAMSQAGLPASSS